MLSNHAFSLLYDRPSVEYRFALPIDGTPLAGTNSGGQDDQTHADGIDFRMGKTNKVNSLFEVQNKMISERQGALCGRSEPLSSDHSLTTVLPFEDNQHATSIRCCGGPDGREPLSEYVICRYSPCGDPQILEVREHPLCFFHLPKRNLFDYWLLQGVVQTQACLNDLRVCRGEIAAAVPS